VHPDGAAWSLTLEINGGAKLRELGLRDLLLNDAAESKLWRLIRRDLSRQISEVYTEDDARDRRERLDTANETYQAFRLTSSGLEISYSHSVFGYSVLDATVPYAQLRGILAEKFIPKAKSPR